MAKQYASSNFNRRWFISHRGCDSALAVLVETTLQELEQNTILDTYDFQPGQNFKFRMSEASKTSDHTICILTESFFSSQYCEAEFNEAFAADPENWNQRLVIIMAGEMKDEDIPEYARDLVYIDFRHCTPEEMVEILKLKIPAILRETQRPDPDLQHEILVIFAKFRNLPKKNGKSNPGWRWATQLRYEQQELLASEDIGFIELEDEIENEDQAHRLLKNSGAQLIIWGDVDDDFVGLHQTFDTQLDFSGLPKRSLVASETTNPEKGWIKPQSFDMFMKSGGDSEYGLNFLAAIVAFKRSQFEKSIQYLNRCVDIFPFETLSDVNSKKYFAELVDIRGIAKMELGDFRGAGDDYELAISYNPNFSAAYNNLGLNRSRQGDHSGAIEYYDIAVSLKSDYTTPIFNRGCAQHDLGNYTEAIKDFDTVINLYPGDSFPHITRGRSKQCLGDNSAALADFLLAIELDPQLPEAYVSLGSFRYDQHEYQAAIVCLNTAIGLDPEHAVAYADRGMAKWKLGDLQGALVDFNTSIDLNPRLGNVHYNRGLFRLSLGDSDGAISDFNVAVEIDPKSAAAYCNRGVAKVSRDTRAALDDLNTALELDPNLAIAYFNRGALKLEIGEFDGAYNDYGKAIGLDRRFESEFIRRMKEEGDDRKAVDGFTAMINLGFESEDLYFNRGLANSNLSNYVEAVTDYSKAIDFNPTQGGLYNKRGSAKFMMNDFAGAIADYDFAINFGYESADLYNNRGVAKIGIGDYLEAIADFDKAIDTNPDDPTIYKNRADLYRHLGNKAQYKRDKEMYWKLIESRSHDPIIRS